MKPGGAPGATVVVTSSSPAVEPKHGNELVLVVEDEKSVRGVVRQTLENHGYRVIDAECAETAQLLFTEHAVDLLLTDVVMPGQSGPELFRALARERPDLKVLLMSGYSPADLFDDGGEELPLIPKPFTGRELCARVRELLDNA